MSYLLVFGSNIQFTTQGALHSYKNGHRVLKNAYFWIIIHTWYYHVLSITSITYIRTYLYKRNLYYTVSYQSGKKCRNISYLNAARNFTCWIMSFIEHINFKPSKKKKKKTTWHSPVQHQVFGKSTLHHMPQKYLVTLPIPKWYSLCLL